MHQSENRRPSVILIVDPDEIVRAGVERVLTGAGHPCRTAADVDTAEGLLGDGAVALALLDIDQLPSARYQAFVSRLREFDPLAALLVTTWRQDGGPAELAQDVDAAGYLVKPYALDGLRFAVDSALDRRALQVAAAERSADLERVVELRTHALKRTLEDLEHTAEELRERDERFRSLAECSPSVIMQFDGLGSCRYANPAATGWSGLPTEALVGYGWRDAIHPEDVAQLDRWLCGFETDDERTVSATQDTGPAGRSPTIEHRWVGLDGSVRWARARLAPTFGDDGRPMGFVLVAEDITDAKRGEQELRRRAMSDDLTGLANRPALFAFLADLLDGGGRDRCHALLFLDIDRFKLVNDSHGHGVGDHVLRVVASRLAETVGDRGLVARLGGDDFVIVLSDPGDIDGRSRARVLELADRLLAMLRLPIRHNDTDFTLAGSVGVAFAHPERRDGQAAELLLSDADIAQHRAKRLGGNGYEVFDSQMRVEISDRIEVESGLRHAIERGEFVLHYQPEFTGSGRLAGFEALIRWNHPVKGMVSPATFIPVAEESGLIIPLGRWVIADACAQACRWNEMRRRDPIDVSVNLSAHQLRDPLLVECVASSLARTGLPPHQFIIEITESVLMDDPRSAIPVLEALRALGVRLSIDDFGTGYSSLGYLAELPLDFLKIDRCFVSGIGVDRRSEDITRAVIQLAHVLDLIVVAEGIERPEQAVWLRAHGCDLLQGFHLGRPAPAERYDPLVAGRPPTDGRPRPAAFVAPARPPLPPTLPPPRATQAVEVGEHPDTTRPTPGGTDSEDAAAVAAAREARLRASRIGGASLS